MTSTVNSTGPPGGDHREYAMRAPCRYCGHTIGRMQPTGGQNCVYCSSCGKLCYNAPKSETGEPRRSVSSRPDIKPSQRARILERDNHTCVGCGARAADARLDIGHIISVKQGKAVGISESDLYDDANLMALCEECNLGQGERSFDPRLLWQLYWAQAIQRNNRQ